MNQVFRRILPLMIAGGTIAGGTIAGGTLIAPIAHAQPVEETPVPVEEQAGTIEELDAMAEITLEEASGLQFAQEQAARGEFLEAIGTLERLLAHHPKSQNARLLHAVYLCRIDDKIGGSTELAKLKEKKFPEETWAQAQSVCTVEQEG